MVTYETFYRPAELSRHARRLSAESYRLARRLMRRSGSGYVFVPIRSLQHMAVLEADEFIFVDGHERRTIVLAWRGFRAAERGALLHQPVAFEAVHYAPAAAELMRRLPAELPPALEALARRTGAASGSAGAAVIDLAKRRPG